MKFVNFWTWEIKQLSALERIYLTDAIELVLSWDVLKKNYGELDLIKKMLETESGLTENGISVVLSDKERSWSSKDIKLL